MTTVGSIMLGHEALIRVACFVGVLLAMAVWEVWAPRRSLTTHKGRRWFTNLGMVVLNTLLVRGLFPVAAVGWAALVQQQGWGLTHYLGPPPWLALVLGVVILDLVIYLQHVMFHAVPLLWRLHMVHHTDLDFDVTTGVRFHPLEILLSMLIKFVAIAALGPPVLAVLIFEILLNATSLFNHGNVRLPLGLDRVLRWVVVTPDMHRVHHSIVKHETNSNFGFNLAWWDRLFGTYRAQPAAGHDGMDIGLEHYREPKRLGLLRLVVLPFIAKLGGYAINRR